MRTPDNVLADRLVPCPECGVGITEPCRGLSDMSHFGRRLERMIETSDNPEGKREAVKSIIENNRHLKLVKNNVIPMTTNSDEVICRRLIDEYKDISDIDFFVGKYMVRVSGRANPKEVREVFIRLINGKSNDRT